MKDSFILLCFEQSKSHSKDSGEAQPLEQGVSTNTDDTSDSSKSDAFVSSGCIIDVQCNIVCVCTSQSTENISTQALDQQIKNIMIVRVVRAHTHTQTHTHTHTNIHLSFCYFRKSFHY